MTMTELTGRGGVAIAMRRCHRRAFVCALLIASLAFGSIAIGISQPAEADTANVFVGQDAGGAAARKFTPAVVTIAVNDDVYWQWNTYGEQHTVTSYDETTPGFPDWGSGGPGFDYTFTAPGTYTYYCSIHSSRAAAAPNVIDASIAAGAMVGKVIVQALATETATATNTPVPTTTATPTITPTSTITPEPIRVGGVADIDVRKDDPPGFGDTAANGSTARSPLLLTLVIAATISIATGAGLLAIRLRR